MCICVCERESVCVCMCVCVYAWKGKGGRRERDAQNGNVNSTLHAVNVHFVCCRINVPDRFDEFGASPVSGSNSGYFTIKQKPSGRKLTVVTTKKTSDKLDAGWKDFDSNKAQWLFSVALKNVPDGDHTAGIKILIADLNVEKVIAKNELATKFGTVVVGKNAPVGLFVAPPGGQGSLVHTARLTNTAATRKIDAWRVSPRPRGTEVSSASGHTCKSSGNSADPDRAALDETGCALVFEKDSPDIPSAKELITVVVSLGSVKAEAAMRVWAPTFPLEIQLEANVLRPLGLGEFEDFSFGTSSCPKFSSSRVRVYATFSAGNTKRDVKRVDVTSLVSGAIKATSSFANVSAQNGAVYAAGNMPGKQGLRMKEPSTYCLATVARQQPNAAQPIACAHAPTRSTDPTTRWTGQRNTHKPAGVPPPPIHPPPLPTLLVLTAFVTTPLRAGFLHPAHGFCRRNQNCRGNRRRPIGQ